MKENNVKFLRLQFVDLFGVTKNVELPESQFERALNGEVMFDGSSVEGMVRIEESDMLLEPDLETFIVFPWETLSMGPARNYLYNELLKSKDGRATQQCFDGCRKCGVCQ